MEGFWGEGFLVQKPMHALFRNKACTKSLDCNAFPHDERNNVQIPLFLRSVDDIFK